VSSYAFVHAIEGASTGDNKSEHMSIDAFLSIWCRIVRFGSCLSIGFSLITNHHEGRILVSNSKRDCPAVGSSTRSQCCPFGAYQTLPTVTACLAWTLGLVAAMSCRVLEIEHTSHNDSSVVATASVSYQVQAGAWMVYHDRDDECHELPFYWERDGPLEWSRAFIVLSIVLGSGVVGATLLTSCVALRWTPLFRVLAVASVGSSVCVALFLVRTA